MWLRVLSQKLMCFLASFFFHLKKCVGFHNRFSSFPVFLSFQTSPHSIQISSVCNSRSGKARMQRENDKFRGSSRSCKRGGGWEVEVRRGGAPTAKNHSNPGGMQRSEAREAPSTHC